MVDEVHEQDSYVERVAAIDVGKNELKVCVRVPGDVAGKRRQQVRTYPARTAAILELSDWLRCEQVGLVVMEATGDYWKPPFFLLEDEFECWLLDAKQVRHLPGRPKTDREDAIWLAKVAERGMARASFVPPKPIRRLRDLTRYRRALTQDRTRSKQRLEKVLEDSQIKLSSVIANIHGVSGRAMLDALIGGQRDPKVLAQLARGSMRGKIAVLQEALTGRFDDHHALICQMMLSTIDSLTRPDRRTHHQHRAGHRPVRASGRAARRGLRHRAHLRAGHHRRDRRRHGQVRDRTALVSWAKFCPQVKQSGGKTGPQRRGRQRQPVAGRRAGRVGDRRFTHTHFPRRTLPAPGQTPGQEEGAGRGRQLDADRHLAPALRPERSYRDLGADFYEAHVNRQRRQRNLITQLEQITGKKVTLQPVA